MTIERMLTYIENADYEKFGRLVTEYAIGYRLDENGLPPKEEHREPLPWPSSLAEFKKEVEARQIGKVRDELVGFDVVQPSDINLVLMLPPKAMVEQAIAHFAGQGGDEEYKLPDFYRTMLMNGDPWPKPQGMEHLPFWYCRVGDYTMSFCG